MRIFAFLLALLSASPAIAQEPNKVCYGLLLVPYSRDTILASQVITGYRDLAVAREAKAILLGGEGVDVKTDMATYRASPQYKIDQENKRKQIDEYKKRYPYNVTMGIVTALPATGRLRSYSEVRIFPSPCS